MTTAVQVQSRRGTAAQVAAFTGAQGEVVVDTTNNRVVVQDGVTVGGWPAAKLSEVGGCFLNKFRNSTMDVWQRGTSMTVTTAGAYTADGWIVTPAGASVAVAQASGRLLTKNSLQVTGAASVTDVQIAQRIESLMAAPFCSQTVTVQAEIYNNTGAAITPALTVNHAASQDSWSSPSTDVSAASLQSCANGAWTQVAYTFQASANCYNGLDVIFDFGNNFSANTKSIQIAECGIRVTNGVPTGLNANPPPPELRPIGTELLLCQRYFSVGTEPELLLGAPAGVTAAYSTISLPVTMRAAPTMTLSGWEYFSGGTPTSFTPSVTSTGPDYFSVGSSSLTSWGGWFAVGTWTASAEL